MKDYRKKRANATKRLLVGIIIAIIGFALIKATPILGWILIIVGGLLVIAEAGHVEKLNNVIEEFEKDMKIQDAVNPVKASKVVNSSVKKKSSGRKKRK